MGARRVREGVLRHLAGRHPLRGQLGEDLRAQPPPAVAADPEELGSDAIRRVRGAALLAAAQAVEDGQPGAGGR